MNSTEAKSSADEILPFGKMALLGLQHVLVMYASAVAVPLIIGGAIHLPKDQIAFLISADLFVGGLVTLVQSLGCGWFGIKLPVMMGVSFAGSGAIIAIGNNPALGLPGIFGSMLIAGLIIIALAPAMGYLLNLFPHVVVGTILLTIGVSLLDISAHWMAGGFGAKDFGNPIYIAISTGVLLFILILSKYTRGFINNISVLLGIVAGLIVSMALGLAHFDEVAKAPWLGLIMPFRFGGLKFDTWSIVSMTIVMLVNTIETVGVFMAVSEMTGKTLSKKELVKGFRADGLGAVLGSLFNTFPYTSYSENVGLLVVTRVRSRFVVACAAAILIILALVPKLSAVVASVPVYVLGAMGMIMFGMISVAGIKILKRVDFDQNPANGLIVAISIGIGMAPVLAPQFFDYFPKNLAPLLQSGVVLGAIAAVMLNVFLNRRGNASQESAPQGRDTVPDLR